MLNSSSYTQIIITFL